MENNYLNSALNLIKFPKNHIKLEHLQNPEYLINKRVEVSDSIGVVKYIGNLKHKIGNTSEEIWIGIEWDDPTRGKHNGTVEGFEYFKTSHPTSGSLIKFNKVNFGSSFLEMIKFKYNFHGGDEVYQFLNRAVESDLYIQANKKRIKIELVGKEKAIQKFSELDRIINVDLSYSFINKIDSNLSDFFPKLEEIILQKTLLNDWTQFIEIIKNFKSLKNLNFSENVLNFNNYEKFVEIKKEIINNNSNIKLNYLVMNKCNLDFKTLSEISFVMKKVETLYLMGNELNDENFNNVDYNNENNIKNQLQENLSNVTFISLERNKIKNFITTIDLLSVYNVLRINLNQNHISKIIHEEEDLLKLEKIKHKLQGLYLDYNKFNLEEDIVKEIHHFENLVDLDILNNNILEQSELAKNNLIGKLFKLQILNNTSITKEMRRDCEIFYLKYCVNEYVKLFPEIRLNFDLKNFEEFMIKNHPNYFILKKKYFDPLEDILENVKKVDMNTIKGNIIEVTFQYLEKKITKKFPKTTTFANLRNLLSKLFKISGNFNFNFNNEEQVTDETKSIDNYSVNSSHIIYLK